jgi:ubiquinone/menaquinone biosynthesis C-methylase UbiE
MQDKRAYFNELAPRWDAIPRPPDAGERIAAFCRRSVPGSTRRILDVGAGTGLLAPHLLEASGAALLVEVDYALAMLRAGRGKSADGRRRLVCADALRLPFRPAAFDAVLCFGILPHLGDARTALAALWSAVAPGGRLSIGHLMGSAELNARHGEIGGPVAADTLPPAEWVASALESLGAARTEAQDRPEGYFVLAERGVQ